MITTIDNNNSTNIWREVGWFCSGGAGGGGQSYQWKLGFFSKTRQTKKKVTRKKNDQKYKTNTVTCLTFERPSSIWTKKTNRKRLAKEKKTQRNKKTKKKAGVNNKKLLDGSWWSTTSTRFVTQTFKKKKICSHQTTNVKFWRILKTNKHWNNNNEKKNHYRYY